MLSKIGITKVFGNECNRSLWSFVYKAFNNVDKDRLDAVGPDRTCAEWILRNGGAVALINNNQDLKVLPSIVTNYNALPNENKRFHLNGIFANGIGIMNIGFEHLLGCENIEKIILNDCHYIENDSLAKLSYVKNSLKFLQITSCHNIENTGLLTLKCLTNLKKLIIGDVPYVQNLPEIETRLQHYLPHCEINLK